MRRLIPFAMLTALPLVACASAVGGSGSIPGIRLAASAPTSCDYVTDVHGHSPFYGVFASNALAGARTEALKAAKAAGANTVVLSKPTSGSTGTSIDGQAWSC